MSGPPLPIFAEPGQLLRRARRMADKYGVACGAWKLGRRVAAATQVAVAAMLAISCVTLETAPPEAFSEAKRPVVGEEVRAVWVVRQSLSSAEEARAVVEEAHGAGFNTVIVQVRGRGHAMYRSTLEPRPEFLTGEPEFDALRVVVEEARARGMAVHAWVNAYIVWGPVDPPRAPGHLVNAHPEWLAVPRELGRELYHVDPSEPSYVRRLIEYAAANIEITEGLYASPTHPGVQERLLAVWKELATGYDLDGIHHDYIRYAHAGFDYSRSTLEEFQEWVKPRIPARRYRELEAAVSRDVYAFVDGLGTEWEQYRRGSITELVGRIYGEVKALNADLVVSAAVFPDWRSAARWQLQEWAVWLGKGILDVAVPTAYTTDTEEFKGWVESALTVAGAPERVWAGIGAYRNPAGRTVDQIEWARALGVSGIVVFSYHQAADRAPAAGAESWLQRIGGAAFRDG